MSDQIKVGDIVQLMSGSPRMTVFAVRKARASCVWNHYPTGVIREQTISLKALVKTGPPAKYQPRRRTEEWEEF